MSLRRLLMRVGRYSEKCVSDRLDPDYAKAVDEMKKALMDCRNELCMMTCLKYRSRDLDACKGCRWEV